MHRRTYERLLLGALGATWTPTMTVGSGCTVHLCREELPAAGRFVVALSRHLTALVDGVVRDLYDPCRDGSRCVYGYYRLPTIATGLTVRAVEELRWA